MATIIPELAHISDWVFDLDNTLYSASSRIFAAVHARMGQFIAHRLGIDLDQAKRIQRDYYQQYGTTLNGLMQCHGIHPDDYLSYVHQIDLSALQPDSQLAAALRRLPGRKWIYTNGSTKHAERVLSQLAIADQFQDIYDIVRAKFEPKPSLPPYRRMLADFAISPSQAAMVEDLPRNLLPAKELGMTTIWLAEPGNDEIGSDNSHADYIITHLAGWLDEITKGYYDANHAQI